MSFYISFECWNKFQALTQALRSWIRQNCLGIDIEDNLVIWLTTSNYCFSEMTSNFEEVKGDVQRIEGEVEGVKGKVEDLQGKVEEVKGIAEDMLKKDQGNQPGKFS